MLHSGLSIDQAFAGIILQSGADRSGIRQLRFRLNNRTSSFFDVENPPTFQINENSSLLLTSWITHFFVETWNSFSHQPELLSCHEK